MKQKTMRAAALLLALVLSAGVAATPVLAAAPSKTASGASFAEENGVVTIRLTAEGDLTYGSPFTLKVTTNPEDAQYIGVVLGVGGEGKGYVTLILSDKIRTLLKMIPLPRKMSATPDQVEEFNVYAYIKQLIDGHDVDVLLRVADEVANVMDTLTFYIPTLEDISRGLKLALELIRRFLPEDAITAIYLDEQPTLSGNYVGGAIALESSDMNTAGVAMFKIKPKSEGVRMYWASDAPETMTLAEAQAFNNTAVLESDGQIIPEAKISYTYKKADSGFLSDLFGTTISGFPTEPGSYIQTATVSGNYSCSKISRNITIE